jgi:hypothetical protein
MLATRPSAPLEIDTSEPPSSKRICNLKRILPHHPQRPLRAAITLDHRKKWPREV